MILAIHYKPGSFSDRWMDYCKSNDIPFKMVNCLSNNIIDECADCAAVFWHWHHYIFEEFISALQIITALETLGLEVFPNSASCWHYDDKLAQKYLLEALGAPVVPSYAFYDRASVIKWIKETEFPKVFKLRRGAGSNNVLLVRDRRHARSLCNKAFSTGFVAMPHYLDDFSMKIRKVRWHSDIWEKILRGPQTLVNIWKIRSQFAREKGYMLFQDFIPNNTYDTRVTIIGNRAFGFIRGVRPNDFRASGSGLIDWHKENVDFQCVRAAFEVAKKIGAQSLAFDFVKDAEGHPLIAEISYTYLASAVYQCSGHWDEKLNWHEGHVWPQDAIMQDMLEKLSGR